MKYMGHKGRVLEAIAIQVERAAGKAHAICDPFCGSGVVAWELAQRFPLPVMAGDLQAYACARAAGVVTRTHPLNDLDFVDRWIQRAERVTRDPLLYLRLPTSPDAASKTKYLGPRKQVLGVRAYVAHTLRRALKRDSRRWPITLAYAGYYFSIEQALLIDALRQTLPQASAERATALCALIGAASRCSASPGHTAQPFGLSRRSLPHLVEAWNRSVREYLMQEIASLASRYARVQGETCVASWEQALDSLSPGDVVFCDPPYSAVQYSRFYHVLETLARGEVVVVSGTGRNPPFSQRPESDFSRKTKAKNEVERLLRMAAERDLRLVITFPVSKQSNGLSAYTFTKTARRYFARVKTEEVCSYFSSLGGNGANGHRPARETAIERIISCY